MRELRTNPVERKDRHDVSEINEIKYVYIDKYGILHASDFEDWAYEYGNGKYIATDEISTNHGYFVVNGIQIKIYGAGEGYVYRTKEAKEADVRYNVTEGPIKGSNFEHVALPVEVKDAYRIANSFYVML